MLASEGEGLSDEELLGQMSYVPSLYFCSPCILNMHFPSTFVIAGADSTANAICTMMDILSRNQIIQDKLRAELTEAQERFDNDIPHDELVALPYMDAFCRETLRLYVVTM